MTCKTLINIAKGTAIIASLTIACSSTSAYAFDLKDGLYELHSHPDGGARPPLYGLRLDGLLTGYKNDVYTFNFNHPDSNMRMTIQGGGSQIKIFGDAFGGLDIGGKYCDSEPDCSKSDIAGLWRIDFTYDNAMLVPGDDDLIVDKGKPTNRGIITQLYGDQRSFNLEDYAGSHSYTFRLGDKNDDNGHRGYDGISGWGWLNHAPTDDGLGGSLDEHLKASDWLFTAKPVPTPALLPGLIGMGLTALRKKKQGVVITENT